MKSGVWMFHLTFMGGSEVRLKEADNIVVTVMGGTEIRMPTLAEKIIQLRKAKLDGLTHVEAARRTNVITLMGGTAFRIPTVGAEIEEMCVLRDSGLVTDEELRSLWQEVIQLGAFDMIETFTVMGGAGEEAPSRKDEIQSLEKLVLKGVISAQDLEDWKQFLERKPGASGRELAMQEKLRNLLLPPGRENPVFLPAWKGAERKLSTFE